MIEITSEYYENKYFVSSATTDRFHAFLSHYFLPLKTHPTGINQTLYFDTHDLEDYYQGISGSRNRKKIRVRQYLSDKEDNNFCVFEIKTKIGQIVSKRKVRLENIRITDDLTIGKLSTLSEDVEKLLIEEGVNPGLYLPKLLIQYRRSRFISPGTDYRLNVDTAICSECYWITKSHPLVFPLKINGVFLEVKGISNPSLPGILFGCGARRISLSKYCFLSSSFLDAANLHPDLDPSADLARLQGG
jgi:SPX domain protein involved in polyphosphate accumulation